MAKKKNTVISYAGHRVLLETVASYVGIWKNERNKADRYGVRFRLRNGDIVEAMGDDEEARDNVLDFLDDYFAVQRFTSNLCEVCIHKADEEEGDCYRKHNHCGNWGNRSAFEREESDDTRSMDASA